MNRKEYKEVYIEGILLGIFIGSFTGLLFAGILEKL